MSNQPTSETGGDHTAAVSMSAGVERTDVTSPSPVTKQRSLRAVYVLNDGLKAVAANSPESGALQCLQRACDAESAILTTVTFGRLDFGETTVLDTFYDAGEALQGRFKNARGYSSRAPQHFTLFGVSLIWHTQFSSWSLEQRCAGLSKHPKMCNFGELLGPGLP